MLPCPDLTKSSFEPADIEYQYLDGSLVYIGRSSITYYWPFMTAVNVGIVRGIYAALVASVDPATGIGSPISCTIPDNLNGGLRTTTAYMAEPTGTAGGDGSKDFKVTLYNLHEAAFLAAIEQPDGNLFDAVSSGRNVRIGGEHYSRFGWQF